MNSSKFQKFKTVQILKIQKKRWYLDQTTLPKINKHESLYTFYKLIYTLGHCFQIYLRDFYSKLCVVIPNDILNIGLVSNFFNKNCIFLYFIKICKENNMIFITDFTLCNYIYFITLLIFFFLGGFQSNLVLPIFTFSERNDSWETNSSVNQILNSSIFILRSISSHEI